MKKTAVMMVAVTLLASCSEPEESVKRSHVSRGKGPGHTSKDPGGANGRHR